MFLHIAVSLKRQYATTFVHPHVYTQTTQLLKHYTFAVYNLL